MLNGAWWTYVVLALSTAGAGGRLYERCELARDLRGLGVRADHIATWVCIAFHESRFDTAARNPYSGDHGLLQISELYWCGGGKACGLPCDALRDEDIADDVACALRVHEEHTRLQGDGFMAWVAYPQHCKHNTKKYLVDCDETLKNASTKPMEKSRALSLSTKENVTLNLNPRIDELLPPYISSTSNSGQNRNRIEVQEKVYHNKWQVTHFSNIDDLSLPTFGQKTLKTTESPDNLPSTTTTPGLRKTPKSKKNEFVDVEPLVTNKPLETTVSNYNQYEPSTRFFKTTTVRPNHVNMPVVTRTTISITPRPPLTTTNLYRSSFLRASNSSQLSSSTPTLLSKDTSKNRYRCLGCRTLPTNKLFSGSRLTTTQKPFIFKTFTSDTAIPITTRKTTTTIVPNTRKFRIVQNHITSLVTSTTRAPSIFTTRSRFTTLKTTTPRNKATTRSSSTSRIQVPVTSSTTLRTTTPSATSSSRRWRTLTAETENKGSNRTTQTSERNAIFDLYLTSKKPKLTTYVFGNLSNKVFKRRIIFADGTTSPATPLKRRSDRGGHEFRIK